MSCSLNAVTASGTSCTFASRLVAVTMISSSACWACATEVPPHAAETATASALRLKYGEDSLLCIMLPLVEQPEDVTLWNRGGGGYAPPFCDNARILIPSLRSTPEFY